MDVDTAGRYLLPPARYNAEGALRRVDVEIELGGLDLEAAAAILDWLVAREEVDLSRRLTPYINAFPRSYLERVLQASYAPGREAFADDYLADNADRNRALDVLPLLAHLDEGRVRAMRRRTSNRRTVLPRKTVRLEPHARLHDLLRRNRFKVNSLHHQAIDRLGDGLRVAALDLDDLVQAVECERSRFRLGVQWHPEYLFDQPRQQRLFEALVSTAARVA